MQQTRVRSLHRPITIRPQNVRLEDNPGPIPVHQCPVSVQTVYENTLSVAVYMTLRSGVTVFIPSTFGHGSVTDRHFIVRQVYKFARHTRRDMEDTMGVLTNNPSMETQCLKTALNDINVQYRNTHTIFTVTYRFTEDEIGRYPHGIYVPEVDTVFSLDESIMSVVHPYGEASRRMGLAEEASDRQGLRYNLKIVDNENRYTQRFVNIHGRVFEVPKVLDPTMEDGVYYVTNQPACDEDQNQKIAFTQMSVEEADEMVPLFKTIEDAKVMGDFVEHRERQLKLDTLQRREEAERHAAERVKAERKKAVEEEGRRYREREHQARQERKREGREDRRANRRDAMDLVKFVPAFLSAVAALAAAVSYSKQ